MITMEHYAQTSRLRRCSPGLKAGFAGASLLAGLLAESNALSLGIFLLMSFACTAAAGIPLRRYLRLCCIPFVFLLVGALTIAVGFAPEPIGRCSLPLAGSYLVLTKQGLEQALTVFSRSMAGVSCLYFLYVSTPIHHLLGVLSRFHVPALLLELMLMIYRFIFILLAMAEQITIAQKARLGNSSRRAALRSVAVLASTIFVNALQKSNLIYNAMESRGYTGSLTFTEELPVARRWQRFALAAYAVALVAVLLIVKIAG